MNKKKKNFIKRLVIIIIILAMLMAIVVPTFASEAAEGSIILPTGEVFYPNYYAELNTDVVDVVGTNKADLYKHYLEFGRNEKRPYTTKYNINEVVDGDNYTTTYRDVDGRIYTEIHNEILNINSLGVQPYTELKLVGHCSTNYDESYVNRSTNIKLAAGKINNSVIKPGEVYSYSLTVGPRKSQYGFKVATVYSGGKVAQGIGGGICQVSSTLYSAIKDTDIGIVERHPHSLPVSYLPKGRDAAISWGVQDLKIKNTHENPLIIQTICEDGRLDVFVLEIIEPTNKELETVN